MSLSIPIQGPCRQLCRSQPRRLSFIGTPSSGASFLDDDDPRRSYLENDKAENVQAVNSYTPPSHIQKQVQSLERMMQREESWMKLSERNVRVDLIRKDSNISDTNLADCATCENRYTPPSNIQKQVESQEQMFQQEESWMKLSERRNLVDLVRKVSFTSDSDPADNDAPLENSYTPPSTIQQQFQHLERLLRQDSWMNTSSESGVKLDLQKNESSDSLALVAAPMIFDMDTDDEDDHESVENLREELEWAEMELGPSPTMLQEANIFHFESPTKMRQKDMICKTIKANVSEGSIFCTISKRQSDVSTMAESLTEESSQAEQENYCSDSQPDCEESRKCDLSVINMIQRAEGLFSFSSAVVAASWFLGRCRPPTGTMMSRHNRIRVDEAEYEMMLTFFQCDY